MFKIWYSPVFEILWGIMRSKSKAIFLILLGAITISFQSCMSKSNDSTTIVRDNRLVKIASCEYSFNEGGIAASSLPKTQNETMSFGKVLDISLLKSIYQASGEETVRFINLTGATVYRTNFKVNEGSCFYAQAVPEAPADLMNKFINVDLQNDGHVLGLFLPKNTENLYSLNSQAAVLIRNDSDKWTLVHEFTHHLFSKEVETLRSSDNLMYQRYTALDKFKRLDQLAAGNYTEQNLSEMANHAYIFGESHLELMRRFPLEEMAIESLLGRSYRNSILKYVSYVMMLNGQNYIQDSAEDAIDRMKAAQDLLSRLLDKMKKNGMLSQSYYQQIENLISQYQNIMPEVLREKNEASYYLSLYSGFIDSRKANLLSPELRKPSEHLKGCEHDQKIKAADQRIKEMLNDLSF